MCESVVVSDMEDLRMNASWRGGRPFLIRFLVPVSTNISGISKVQIMSEQVQLNWTEPLEQLKARPNDGTAFIASHTS